MKTDFKSIFICMFLFSFLQSKFAFGQDSLQTAKQDSSNVSQKSMVEDKKDKLIAGKDSISLKKAVNNFASKLKSNSDLSGKTDTSNTTQTDTSTNKNNQLTSNIKSQYTDKLSSQRQNKDSLFKKNFLFSKNDTILKSVKPMAVSFFNNQLKSIKPLGTVSLGYEYGVLPFVAGNNYPSGGLKTEGKVSLLVLKIPLELSYYYTNIKNVIGLNNYFRISYDANRYKEQLNEALNDKDQLNQKLLVLLQLRQQKVFQKMEYLNFLKQNSSYKIPTIDSSKNSLNENFNTNPNLTDSLPINLPNSPLQGRIDSVKNYYAYAQKRDSISKEFNKYNAKYNAINDDIKEVEKEMEQAKNFLNNPTTLLNPSLSKFQQFASHIKKFEVGLCSPSYSTFLVNNVPLQGINVEYAAKDIFLAFTYGTTVNNLMYNTNTIQGTIQGARNLYNYFDFGNVSVGRKILSLKGGIGAKEDSHLYIGVLAGKGRTDYLQPLNDPSSFTKESNVVMELDAKYKLSQQLSVDVIIGKSSVKEEDLTMEQVKKAVNEILSDHRSYACLAKVNFEIEKTNTKLSVTTRWIDPYFKSFGIGFLRSDNFRYEIKAEQPITKKIKYTIAYRFEEDNILKLYNYKNTLQSVNNSLNFKINRQFNVRLNYVPLYRELKSANTIIINKNQITTVILSFIPKTKKINAQFNALGSKYIISGDSTNINFENFTYTHQLLFTSGFKTGFNASWFKNSLKDTLNNDVYLAVLDVGYSTKNKNSLTIGGKLAYKAGTEMQYGFVAKITIRLYKGLFWETNAEKIIIGDYYNSFIIDKIKKFPYYCNSKLILNF